MTLNDVKAGEAVRINNTVYVKQANGMWKGPLDTKLDSSFKSFAQGKKIDFLNSSNKNVDEEKKVAKKQDFQRFEKKEMLNVSNKEAENKQ